MCYALVLYIFLFYVKQVSAQPSGISLEENKLIVESLKVDEWLDHYFDGKIFSGNILITQHGSSIYSKSFGYRNVGSKLKRDLSHYILAQ